MILLECLHDMDENATHPFPLLEPSLTPSSMLKPNARKTSFSKQKVFVLENVLPSFGRYIGLLSRIPGSFFRNSHGSASEMSCWTTLQGKSSENLPLKFLSQPFFNFSFLSFHALTPNFLSFPGAYEMHYSISNHTCQYINYAYINNYTK